ncbi:MAG: hypothetical protein NC489_44160, partial [Ruminococcus flavefaciens]|nr:hypothetical protein [Ruminococcus flavefaciens]
EVKAEVKEEVKAEVKEEVKAEVKEEIKAEVKEEIKAEIQNAMNLEYIKILIETVHEYRGTKENAAAKIREKFPEYTNQAEELVEKYWMES